MSGSSRSSLGSLFSSPPPPAAVEISSRRVSVVAVSAHGGTRTITGQTTEPLPPGLVTPSLNAVNVHDVAALGEAVKAAVDRITPRPKRVALILPDTVVKVSMLRFEKLPKAQDFEQLVRWQIRKSIPFRVEDAQVTWTDGADIQSGGREVLVLASRRDIVQSYERACDVASIHAGIVDVASLNLVNAVLATVPSATSAPSSEAWLLVHAEPEFATLIVVRGGRVIFYRNRPSEAGATDMGDLVHQTAMYFEDRLGGGAFARVYVAGASSYGPEADLLRRQIEERLGVRVNPLDVRGGVAFRDRIAAGPELLDAIAPAVGVLLRDRPVSGGRAGEQVA
jgi:Tfp pilus assembly PilM family ATPase